MLIDWLCNSDSSLNPFSTGREGTSVFPSLLAERGHRGESKKQNIPTQYIINNNPPNIPTVLLSKYCINRRKNYYLILLKKVFYHIRFLISLRFIRNDNIFIFFWGIRWRFVKCESPPHPPFVTQSNMSFRTK